MTNQTNHLTARPHDTRYDFVPCATCGGRFQRIDFNGAFHASFCNPVETTEVVIAREAVLRAEAALARAWRQECGEVGAAHALDAALENYRRAIATC